MYQVLYRKWRPRTFDEVAGQPHVTSTLSNELKSGKFSHAYLFTGSRGTGKTTCAKILSKAVNCLNPVNGNPCNECEICKGIDNGSILDVIEIDAASNNGVDNIRDLREEANYTPVKAKYRVYIIDEVHMLSIGAFNALLKTLEEPPAHVIFILATTEVHKLPATILSRCQRFDFRRIPQEDMSARLNFVAKNENIELSPEAAVLISRVADGALRDALSILDRCSAKGEKITPALVSECVGIANRDYLFEMADYICSFNSSQALELLNSLYKNSCDMERLCSDLIHHFRNLMIVKTVKQPQSLIICTAVELKKYKEQSSQFKLERILNSLSVLENASLNIKKSLERKIEVEMAIVRLCSESLDTSSVLKRLQELESAFKKGIKAEIKKEDAAPSVEIAEKAEEKANNKNPAPENSSQGGREQSSASNEDIPFISWPEVIAALNEFDKPIAGVLTGSTAFLRGEFVLIKSENSTFEKFIKIGSHAGAVKDAILKITGKRYRLGIYKKEGGNENQSNDPLSNLINKINNFKGNLEE